MSDDFLGGIFVTQMKYRGQAGVRWQGFSNVVVGHCVDGGGYLVRGIQVLSMKWFLSLKGG